MSKEPSLYYILQIDKLSSKSKIKGAYRKLVKKYHPDINKNENAEKIFIQIHTAYSILIDDEKRKEYDANFEFDDIQDEETSTEKKDEKETSKANKWESVYNFWKEAAKEEAEIFLNLNYLKR